eukprot:6602043-Pyramimonas_sp.AAC.1
MPLLPRRARPTVARANGLAPARVLSPCCPQSESRFTVRSLSSFWASRAALAATARFASKF